MKKLSLFVAALILGGMLVQVNAEETAQQAESAKPAVTASKKSENKLAKKPRKSRKKAEKTDGQAAPARTK